MIDFDAGTPKFSTTEITLSTIGKLFFPFNYKKF